jgi:hypothetical protein
MSRALILALVLAGCAPMPAAKPERDPTFGGSARCRVPVWPIKPEPRAPVLLCTAFDPAEYDWQADTSGDTTFATRMKEAQP